jgi:hypothetical protein
VLTKALHRYLFRVTSVQSIAIQRTRISLTSILILFTHMRLGLPSGFFSFGFRTIIVYTFMFLHVLHACPSHRLLLDHSSYTCRIAQITKLLITQFLSPPVTLSLLVALRRTALPPTPNCPRAPVAVRVHFALAQHLISVGFIC